MIKRVENNVSREHVGIRPEEVPTFKLVREKDGLQVWSIENGGNSKEEFLNCRRFCYSHFGRKFLWYFTRDFKVWNKYNACPKEIATFDGKPLAIKASLKKEDFYWLNTQGDPLYTGLFIEKSIPDDRLCRFGTVEYDLDNFAVIEWHNIHIGDKSNGEYRKWGSLDEKSLEYIAEYKDGEMISVVIPDGYPYIGCEQFAACHLLEEIHIPDSVEMIGMQAFAGCGSLKKVHIPDGIETLDDETFYGCCSLESIEIPDSVQRIGAYAFAECTSLESINIPENVTEIAENAFKDCCSLKKVHISKASAEKFKDKFPEKVKFVYTDKLNSEKKASSIKL